MYIERLELEEFKRSAKPLEEEFQAEGIARVKALRWEKACMCEER